MFQQRVPPRAPLWAPPRNPEKEGVILWIGWGGSVSGRCELEPRRVMEMW
ncbi:Protein of unknown function [Pyronema omphalodes CBS 100304]|uniref:Uncharacterized protein n=1 Tax=Pyronema omphalodes (strain CBS 100304) TaxID=1076935 RepID=U4KYL0_PYROM|nr:Protein of unknown function [Pyronema omphalodes CBS 100304]